MIAKTKAPSIAPLSELARQARPWPMAPWTTEEHQQRIEWLSHRINEYVEFICRIDSLDGASAEAKEKAVAAFHERMVLVERELGRIHDDFQLC